MLLWNHFVSRPSRSLVHDHEEAAMLETPRLPLCRVLAVCFSACVILLAGKQADVQRRDKRLCIEVRPLRPVDS